VKLIDAKALGFVTSHKPPSGEICIRGMSVAQRYLDDDALTYIRPSTPDSPGEKG
jgi:acyl-CoA synthetase (AMP-forming)/AMP-acid ligase II